MVIYFIRRISDGAIKIGYSRSVKDRVQVYKHDGSLQLICLIDGDLGTEKKLHEIFAEYRISGEWFEPGKDLLEYIGSFAIGDVYRMDEFKSRRAGDGKRHLNLVVSDEAGLVLDGIKKRGGFKSLDNAMDSFLKKIKETSDGADA